MVSLTDSEFFEAINPYFDWRAIGELRCGISMPAKSGMPESYYQAYSEQQIKQQERENGQQRENAL